MAEGTRKTAARTTGGLGERTAEVAAKQDPRVERLLKAGQSLGNQELKSRVDNGNATRDELLAFIIARLHTIREAQLREVELCGWREQRDWWKVASDSHLAGHGKPEPTRWRECAILYDLAAAELCLGDLRRGTEQLRRAIDAEKRAFDELTKIVNVDDLEELREPGSLLEAAPTQTCGDCDVPPGVAVADQVVRVTTEVATPPNDMRTADPWWTEPEEEEEEKPNDAGGGS